MKKIFKEISLLVVLPLVLTSMSLAIIGISHTTKFTQVNRILKIRESEDIPIHCGDVLCQDSKNLEDAGLWHL